MLIMVMMMMLMLMLIVIIITLKGWICHVDNIVPSCVHVGEELLRA